MALGLIGRQLTAGDWLAVSHCCDFLAARVDASDPGGDWPSYLSERLIWTAAPPADVTRSAFL